MRRERELFTRFPHSCLTIRGSTLRKRVLSRIVGEAEQSGRRLSTSYPHPTGRGGVATPTRRGFSTRHAGANNPLLYIAKKFRLFWRQGIARGTVHLIRWRRSRTTVAINMVHQVRRTWRKGTRPKFGGVIFAGAVRQKPPLRTCEASIFIETSFLVAVAWTRKFPHFLVGCSIPRTVIGSVEPCHFQPSAQTP